MIFKNRIFGYLIFLYFFISTAALFSQYNLDYLDRSQLQELKNSGIIFSKATRADELKLVPPELLDSVKKDLRKVRPNVISEALLMVQSENTREADLLYLFNEFIKVDSLDSIYYYNPEKETDNLLFRNSYRVSSIKTLEPLENLKVDHIPGSLNFLVYQNFKPIGPMISQYEFKPKYGGLEMTVWNVTPMKGPLLNIINRNKFYSRIVILPMDGGFVFYGIGAVRLFNPFNILGNKIDPFYYRISGIFKWYVDEILLPMSEPK